MKEVVSKLKKFFSSFENLDNRYQFAIVGAFLLLVYVFKILKVRKIQSSQHKKLREMAANIHDMNKQKRDGIIWFFQLFVGLSFLCLFLLIGGYCVFLLKLKPIIQFLDVLKIDENKCASILKIALLIFVLTCLVLYKLIYHYNAKITRKAPLNDQELQQEMDRIKATKEEAKRFAKQQESSKQSEVESPSKHEHQKTD